MEFWYVVIIWNQYQIKVYLKLVICCMSERWYTYTRHNFIVL